MAATQPHSGASVLGREAPPSVDRESSPRRAWADRRRGMEEQRLAFSPDGPRSLWPDRFFCQALTIFQGGFRLAGLQARGRRNALDVQLVTRSVSFRDLPPSFDGYRILHLSDTHLDCLPDLVPVATHLLSGVEADLLVLTGDIHGRHRAPLAASTGPLADLIRAVHVKDRRLAILGNHDPADMAEALDDLGLDVLINESTVLEKRGERIVVTGLDDVHRFFTENALHALSQSPAGFRIALVHSGEVADHAAAAGYSLYLCGHTHGGQICLPGGRPIVTRLRRCRYAGVGAWTVGNMAGYTSRGLGVGDVAMRFNCRGEISIITLRRS
jgi:uncharacterized protein